MKRRIYFVLGIALLLLALLVLLPRKGESTLSNQPAAHETTRKSSSRLAASPGDHPDGERRLAKRERDWIHAKDVTPDVNGGEPVESPVFLSYLQSDPSHTKLRIGLRQETNAEVDATGLEVRVDLFDAEGNPLGAGNDVSTEWKTGDAEFNESAAPVLMVTSSAAISGVNLTLIYKDKQIENRRYTLQEP